jgi:hypothetical protein
MSKETCLNISEAHCCKQSKKNLDILDFSLLETFWKMVEKNCALSLTLEIDQPLRLQNYHG